MTTKELKGKYKTEYLRVRELMNEFDPCELLASGAPDDEYDCITNQVISAVMRRILAGKIKDLILDELENHFGIQIPTDEPYKTTFCNNMDIFIQKAMDFNKHSI